MNASDYFEKIMMKLCDELPAYHRLVLQDKEIFLVRNTNYPWQGPDKIESELLVGDVVVASVTNGDGFMICEKENSEREIG